MATILDRQADDRSHVRTFTFTLILSGVHELTDEIERAIYDSGCDDGLLGMVGGEIFVDIERVAPSFREAVVTAIRDVEAAGHGIRTMRIELPETSFIRHLNSMLDLRGVSASDIAEKADAMLKEVLDTVAPPMHQSSAGGNSA